MKVPVKRKLGSAISLAIAIIIIVAFICENLGLFKEDEPTLNVNGSCQVNFIDVGQGDSILISSGGANVLIDAGENNRGDEVLAKIRELKIDKLDLVIGTHAHSDHIGGLDTVLNSIKVDKILLSDLPDSLIPTTKTYTDLLEAIVQNDVELIVSEVGLSFEVGDGKLTILGPVKNNYSDLNNFSIVTRLVFGETSFLFMGDAEEKAENDILDSGANLSADLLKVGHHGSKYSTSQSFLKAVSPDTAVIQVGIGNKYGHPMSECLNRLSDDDVKIYRNDFSGTITAVSDGKSIKITTQKE